MRLSLFRTKLAYEVREAKTIIQQSNYAYQEVASYLYCIAALLRKIMTRLTDFGKYELTVIGTERNINLGTLCNKILHYSWLGASMISSDQPLRTIRILSDKDINLSVREIYIMEFLQIAERIAKDDDLILLNLLKHTQTRLGNVINKSYKKDNVMTFREIECAQSLMDFFEIAGKQGNNIWPEGNITLFRENSRFRENYRTIIKEVTGLENCQIDYEFFCKKLFSEWHFCPFRQFEIYTQKFPDLESQKTIDLEDHSGEDFGLAFPEGPARVFMIRAQDMLNLLNIIHL